MNVRGILCSHNLLGTEHVLQMFSYNNSLSYLSSCSCCEERTVDTSIILGQHSEFRMRMSQGGDSTIDGIIGVTLLGWLSNEACHEVSIVLF